jgi:hypothetical protein
MVKELARGDGEMSHATWNNVSKQLGTFSAACASKLARSGLWRPGGLPPHLIHEFARRLEAREAAETEERKKVEREKAAAAAAAAAATVARQQADTAARAEARKREQLQMRATSTDDVARAAAIGVSESLLAESRAFSSLGPLALASDLFRIERAVHLHALGHRVDVATATSAVVKMLFDESAARAQRGGVLCRKRAGKMVARAAAGAASRAAAVVEAAEEAGYDAHDVAIARILENQRARPPRLAPVLERSCPVCGVCVETQFCECACEDAAFSWRICHTCRVVCSPARLPCRC